MGGTRAHGRRASRGWGGGRPGRGRRDWAGGGGPLRDSHRPTPSTDLPSRVVYMVSDRLDPWDGGLCHSPGPGRGEEGTRVGGARRGSDTIPTSHLRVDSRLARPLRSGGRVRERGEGPAHARVAREKEVFHKTPVLVCESLDLKRVFHLGTLLVHSRFDRTRFRAGERAAPFSHPPLPCPKPHPPRESVPDYHWPRTPVRSSPYSYCTGDTAAETRSSRRCWGRTPTALIPTTGPRRWQCTWESFRRPLTHNPTHS